MYSSVTLMDDVLDLRKKGGKWLKSLRERAGLSQRELAARLGMKFYTFISQLENGTGRIPPDRYESWATALGVPTAEFVKQILAYYDPITYKILFSGENALSNQDTNLTIDRLEAQVRELQRVLGKKTAECEALREKLEVG
jgi:transcriptional regulator with XRE-family HTH domain